LLLGSAAADLSSECMTGLEMLDGDSDIELAVRCRAAFGPEMCRQARHSLGAQPWEHARMKSSCARFASAAAELDGRSLEEAITKKREGTKASSVMDAVAQKKANSPAAAPQKPAGPVAELLEKLQEAEAMPEPASDAEEEQPDAASKGTVVHEEEQHKPALGEASAQAEAGGRAQDGGSEVQKQPEQAKVQDDEQSSSAGREQGARNLELSDMQKVEEVSDVQTMGAQKSAGPKETAALTAADSAVKLFEETRIAMPQEKSRLPAVLGSLVGAASLAGLTLLAASVGRDERRSGTHIQLDPEQEVE